MLRWIKRGGATRYKHAKKTLIRFDRLAVYVRCTQRDKFVSSRYRSFQWPLLESFCNPLFLVKYQTPAGCLVFTLSFRSLWGSSALINEEKNSFLSPILLVISKNTRINYVLPLNSEKRLVLTATTGFIRVLLEPRWLIAHKLKTLKLTSKLLCLCAFIYSSYSIKLHFRQYRIMYTTFHVSRIQCV